MTFRILTVCTGNVCRSPAAELYLSQDLAGLGFVEVSSAGTGALVGEGIPAPGLQLLTSEGFAGESHRARQVTPDIVRAADLVLALSREHRRAIVEQVPAATRRTFTIRELARVANFIGAPAEGDAGAGSAPADGMRAAVLLAAAQRGLVPQPEDAADLDVVDPYRRSDNTYRESFGQIRPAAATIARYLSSAADSRRNV
ncbi:low molecular weight phosphatase family protein [Microbacterium enclense]|uniref:arsenate reductase/protein-tyrosine-phosphatase family protein n=1 Tax=Microbacterium enclense TaxID=993073 RepID=UPI0021A3E7DA|nr:low molecular weight phosphatase family protein [Microbacterium enclense]MCT2085755.1 low molecular weight phosphatase family protein [Microbacterium enclense]